MKFFQLITVLMITISGCNAQQEKNKSTATNDSAKFEPQTEIKVNKEYDDQGNLIRYDSVYASYYSNIENDTLLQDSIFNEFRSHFNDEFPLSSQPFFNEMFFTDSLLYYDFYKDDFFQHRFEQNLYHLDEYFKAMDSLKNQFFKQQFESPEKK